MHPVIMRQLAADHIKEIHAQAEEARRARRGAPSPGPRPPASRTLSYDNPRLARSQRLGTPGQPNAEYDLGEARTCGNESSEARVLLPVTGSRGDATEDCAGSGR